MQQTITLKNLHDQSQTIFDKNVQKFSILLADDVQGNGVFQIPKILQIQTSCILDIKAFVELHQYDPCQIITENIGFYSKPHFNNKNTQQFIDSHLKTKTHQQIQKLMEACNFLKVETLSRIICLYLISLFDLPISDADTKKTLQQYGVDQMSEQKIQQLKIKYFEFFKAYGQNLLDQLQETKQ